jgi:hypothetical protein
MRVSGDAFATTTTISLHHTQRGCLASTLGDICANKNDTTFKKCVYVWGEPGVGKTTLVLETLEANGYNAVRLNSVGTCGKHVMDTIGSRSMSESNALSMLRGDSRRNVVVIDDFDCLCAAEKTFVAPFIRLVRPKKTRRQIKEAGVRVPIVCVGSVSSPERLNHELVEACHSVQISGAGETSVRRILRERYPLLDAVCEDHIVSHGGHNLSKMLVMAKAHAITGAGACAGSARGREPGIFVENATPDVGNKRVTQNMLLAPFPISEHSARIGESDRTIVGLLWHENVVDVLNCASGVDKVAVYGDILKRICVADCIDRTTFQRQAWQLGELSSLTKTFGANWAFHKACRARGGLVIRPVTNVRFTRVLTKYSTEFGNASFIYAMQQKTGFERRDMAALVCCVGGGGALPDELADAGISKIDVRRVLRHVAADTVRSSGTTTARYSEMTDWVEEGG